MDPQFAGAQRALLVRVFLALVLLAHFWSVSPAFAATRIERHIYVGRLDRWYLAYLPDGYQSTAALPVVLAFHGGLGDPEQFADLTRLQDAREARNYIIVFPAGYQRSWNAGGYCCGVAARIGVDDLGFVNALLDDLGSVAHIDRSRVYLTGYSNGSNLSYHFACVAAEEFAAIAPTSGAMRDPPETCRPSRPVPVFDLHGLQDRLSPYNGGMSGAPNAPPDPPVANTIRFWAAADGARAYARASMFGGVAICDVYSDGRDGAKVEGCALPDMGHRWPGAQPTARSLWGDQIVKRLLGDMGPYSPPIDSNDTILRFFSQYRSLPASMR